MTLGNPRPGFDRSYTEGWRSRRDGLPIDGPGAFLSMDLPGFKEGWKAADRAIAEGRDIFWSMRGKFAEAIRA